MMQFEEKLKKYRLSKSEYDLATKLLGHEPQGVEWALFSALWSEHCSYKSSRKHLGKFKLESKRVLKSMGENAGVVDLGEGERVAFKIESHNHPSYIEPYQGAATGVGGILRDIFTMGARPIAVADYLCFGDPDADRMQTIVDGVIRGVGGYGNCVGVPNITGQTEFHSTYNKNVLVNALALGLFRPGEPVCSSNAAGVGNWVVYVGSKTGRDGIHGASMASESFDAVSGADTAKKRPTIQIGDPFFEKLLIEGCIEVIGRNLVQSMQDMGAAGLTSSSFEMAAKGGVGFKIHLDQVPLRDSTLAPEDILLSESQERMLLICEPKNFQAIADVFGKWDLDAQKIGEVTQGPEVELWWHGEQLTKIDPKLLTDEAPMYDRPYTIRKGAEFAKDDSFSKTGTDLGAEIKKALGSLEGCSRDFVYGQYDQRVGAKTVRDASETVGVLRLPDSGRGISLVLGARPHVCRWDPYVGGLDAILYPSLELALQGFETVAATDCLNFGNPERPEVMGDFVAITDGLKDASHALNAPIISGNVSFYNETAPVNVTPTPSTGVVGIRPGIESIPTPRFQKTNEKILLLVLGDGVMTHPSQKRQSGRFSWDKAKWISHTNAIRSLGASGKFSAAHAVSHLGLGYTLAKMSLDGVACHIDNDKWCRASMMDEMMLTPLYSAIVSVSDINLAEVKATVEKAGAKAYDLGFTQSHMFQITNLVKFEVGDLKNEYKSGWGKHFDKIT